MKDGCVAVLTLALACGIASAEERAAERAGQEVPPPLPIGAPTAPARSVPPVEQIPPAAFTTRSANPDYARGHLHRWFFGTHYRALWATPIRAEVLPLATFAGGLTPEKTGGGKETRSLWFRSGDGRRFRVRSLDKDPTAALPEVLQDTVVDQIAQDQISAHHPGAHVVVDALSEAAGIPHVKHRIVVIPDDPALGEFRKEFAGMLGVLEEDPRVEEPVTPGFERFADIEEDWEDIRKRLDEGRDRIDTRAYLYMRLFDMWIGDWDRHEGQWMWALDDESELWVPVPEDRDMAFSKFDGIMTGIARLSQPRLVNFESEYTDLMGLTWNSRFLDRRMLAEFEEPAYREAARALQAKMTDAVIEDAARRMPPEYFALSGPTLIRRLTARREALEAQAVRLYRFLAEDAEVHGTDEHERVEVERHPNGRLTVRLAAANGNGEAAPAFTRTYLSRETDEIRLFLRGGHDRVTFQGPSSEIKVRVVGGPGNDVLQADEGGNTRFYDHEGENRAEAAERVSAKRYTPPLDRHDKPLRDWGGHFLPMPWVSAGSDLGLLAGTELSWTRFGFRKHPWGSRQSLRLGWSTGRQGGLAEYQGVFRETNSPNRAHLRARYSEIEVLHFHGFGNDTSALQGRDFFRSDQRQVLVSPGYTWGDRVALTVAPVAKYTTTHIRAGGFLDRTRPFGVEDFGQVGVGGDLLFDGRNNRRLPTLGAMLTVGGTYYPAVWNVEEGFGEAHGQAAVYLGAPIPLRPSLAVRVAGKRVHGERFPFFESAFLGGPDTVRSLRRERYAGDAAVWGNAELRLQLGTLRVLVPEPFGVFGFYDRGRVWVDERSPGGWHEAYGGGIWLGLLRPENAINVSIARDRDGRTRVYAQGGFAF